MIDEPFSPEEIARQLDETLTGATLSVGPLGDWLLKKKLVRKNLRTGWFDITHHPEQGERHVLADGGCRLQERPLLRGGGALRISSA